MLPELNPVELIFLAAFALIVIGPKDLPVVLRKIGQFTAKMRGLAAEFRASFDEMARQSELDELRKEVEALRNGQFASAQTGLQTHVDDINRHLSTPYWDPATPYAAPEEAAEVAALPPAPAPIEAPPKPKRAPRKKPDAAADGGSAPAPAAKAARRAPKASAEAPPAEGAPKPPRARRKPQPDATA